MNIERMKQIRDAYAEVSLPRPVAPVLDVAALVAQGIEEMAERAARR